MKNFNIYYGGSLKNPFFRGGGFTKNQYIGGNCLKSGGGAWIVCVFEEKEGAVFLRGELIPKCTLCKGDMNQVQYDFKILRRAAMYNAL